MTANLPPRIRAIVATVAIERGLTVDQMLDKTRARKISHARWDAWRRIRALDKPPSFLKMAAMFGYDHTTIIHGVYRDRG